MLAKDAVRKICSDSGMGLQGTAAKLGRSRSWLTCTTSRNRDFTCSTMSEVGRANGYRLCLVPERRVRGEFIVIDPIEREGQEA